jgi:sugar-specific transcriptional regulator TrmB
VQANKKYFEAQSPERLIELIELEKQKLQKKEEELKKQIPQLESLRKLTKESQEGTIYKGKKGLKSIFEDILKYENQTFRVMGASGKFKELFHAYFIHWQNRRVKAHITLHIIYSASTRKEQREKELALSEIKYIENANVTPSTTFIYGDKVAIIMWSEVPLAFLMRSQNVADSYRNFFDMLWDIAKQ